MPGVGRAWFSLPLLDEFLEIQTTIGMTSATRANVADRLWDMSHLVALVGEFDGPQPRKKAGRKPKA